MIGVISAVIAGLMTGSRVLLLAPLVYIVSRKNRDAGLMAYFLLSLYTGGEVFSSSLYTYDGLVTALVYASSMVLLLDDSLLGRRISRLELFVVPFLIAGILFPEAFIAGSVFYFAVRFRIDARVAGVVGAMLLLFTAARGYLDVPGGASNQAVVLAGFALFLAVMTTLRGNLKKVDLFRE
ncbi:hypothetical protein [Thermococcus sp. MAR1]|uniref:hypothetical protein n=1 Tax=Thermococcus sp. MAR1 TaxID=1638263 RepID=UPI00143BBED6|nr:hypothetical protein [Thermococcus sp. MAR1]NJE11142.1 hypothetical protein [Thermococcus sp. MAR1]